MTEVGPAPRLRREILSDHVYGQIKTLIMNGQIPPDARLKTEELARLLGVSPTPVREALARLESEDLTVKLPLRGYSTTALLDAGQVADLYDLRMLLEVPSARRAAQRLADAQAKALTDELATVREAPRGTAYDAYRGLVDHDARLHQLILAIAGNEMVERAFVRTHCHLHIFRLVYDKRLGDEATSEHAGLVAAIVARDPDAAEEAMRAHLANSRDRVLASLDRA